LAEWERIDEHLAGELRPFHSLSLLADVAIVAMILIEVAWVLRLFPSVPATLSGARSLTASGESCRCTGE